MARVNYQREKRLKDLERQRKQEEKRNKKFNKDQAAPVPVEGAPESGSPEGGEPTEAAEPESV